ncbi:MAG TPA: gliding motility protein [Thermoanaerobaculia bacterium]|nr:gliding motility protein [Thermoanaerobaculia bacterium]
MSALPTSLDAPLEAFLAAAAPGERADALVRLVRGIRSAEEGDGGSRALRPLVEALEAEGERREAFARAFATFLAETDGTNLFGDTGIPSDRGFLAEFGDRLSARLVPAPRDARDLSRIFRRLFRTEGEVRRFQERPLDVFHRITGLFADTPPAAAWDPVRRAFADGFRLLASRVQAQGLSRKLRARATPGSVADSPFSRIARSSDAFLAAWLSGEDPAAAAKAFRRDSGDCRKEMKVIREHLERAGVSVDIVFGLEVIDRCLTRMALMADVVEAPAGVARSRALQRLLARLALFAQQDRSLGHLVRWNLHLLDRKIVDRSGETGEHYIAADRSEYRHIWVAAAGGGALTVLTAAVKMAIHGWHLAPFPESFLYGLNYAASFLALQAFGFVLATKQPAMTAAALAGIIRETGGEDREERIAGVFARLTSSQLAAAVSNVLAVGIGSAVFELLWRRLSGASYLGEETARETFETLSPLDSGTVFFAALTGVLLWLGSLAGGWFENWATYHRIPDGLAEHRLGGVVGRARMERLAASFRHNASGWATNVALGFLLGFAPAVGRFFGIPFDVRHVTLSTGTLALAAASLGEQWFFGGWFLRAIAGIGVMFVLNLSVAFSLSLFNAAQAYEMPLGELGGVLRHVGRRALKSPLDFVRPPRPDPAPPGEA